MSDPSFGQFGIDHSYPEWAFRLGERFLAAAQSCGWECDSTFVADGQVVDPPPPANDCFCQLAVVVTPGIDDPLDADGPVCMPVFTAEVRVIVDLCVLLAPQNDVIAPDDMRVHSRENHEALWRIMQGLLEAKGSLAGFGARLRGGPWEELGHSGGSARWQTRWSYRQ